MSSTDQFKLAAGLMGSLEEGAHDEEAMLQSALRSSVGVDASLAVGDGRHYAFHDPQLAIRELPKSVSALLGYDGREEIPFEANVSESELRAARAELLCHTNELALDILMRAMEHAGLPCTVPASGEVMRPPTAPQLEGTAAQANNLRLSAAEPTRRQRPRPGPNPHREPDPSTDPGPDPDPHPCRARAQAADGAAH